VRLRVLSAMVNSSPCRAYAAYWVAGEAPKPRRGRKLLGNQRENDRWG
jgi:hypothetical protein